MESRKCEQCGAEFEPRREHARFCSALCRITWNREHVNSHSNGDTPLNWSVSALEETAERLRKGESMGLPEAIALISEAVWWVTLVDATMVRYHHDAYDRALARMNPTERRRTEGTFTGLRFVRNSMGYYVDPADFIQPQQDSLGRDAVVSAWTWRPVIAPSAAALPQRTRSWEAGRYQHYRVYLADRPVGETINRSAGFLTDLRQVPLSARRLASGQPRPQRGWPHAPTPPAQGTLIAAAIRADGGPRERVEGACESRLPSKESPFR
jgi:hypothetical protein